MSTLKTEALRGTSGTADSIQLHASNQSVTFPGDVTITGTTSGIPTNSPSWCLARTDAWGMAANGWRLIPVNVTTWNVGGGTIAAPADGDTTGASWTCPSDGAGKYFVHANIHLNGGQNHLDDGEYAMIEFQKNDTGLVNTRTVNYSAQSDGVAGVQTSALLDLAAGDKLQAYVYHTESAGGVLHNVNSSQMSGFRLIGV